MKKYLMMLMLLIVGISGCSSEDESSKNENGDYNSGEFAIEAMEDTVAAKEVDYTYHYSAEYADDSSSDYTYIYNPSEDNFKVTLIDVYSTDAKYSVNYIVDSNNEFSEVTYFEGDTDFTKNFVESDYENYDEIYEDVIIGKLDYGKESFEGDFEGKEEGETDKYFTLSLPNEKDEQLDYEITKDATTYKQTTTGEDKFVYTIEFGELNK